MQQDNTSPQSTPVIKPINTTPKNPLLIILILVLLLSLGSTGYFAYQNMKLTKQIANLQKTAVSPSPSASVAQAGNPTANWKTYTSNTEKATFKYPIDWIEVKSLGSVSPNADSFSIQSQNGDVKINWISVVSGLGGGCNINLPTNGGGCPTTTIISKENVPAVPNLIVVSGIVTRDGNTYMPWLAVLDNDSELLTSSRTLGYDEFRGKNNGLSEPGVIFTTGDVEVNGPKLSQADANIWFNKPNVQIAKQILLSLSY